MTFSKSSSEILGALEAAIPPRIEHSPSPLFQPRHVERVGQSQR